MLSISKVGLCCVLLSTLATACLNRTVTIAAQGPAAPTAAPRPHNPNAVWQEHFDSDSLTWIAPFGNSTKQVSTVYSIVHQPTLSFLHALHDARPGTPHPVPAVHIGMQFEETLPPLDHLGTLTWRWRVRQHPAVTDDAWLDVAASLYVIIETPSLLRGGKGFKFGWLAKPAAAGTFQRGLAQIELRSDPAGEEWRSESVDLCGLYRKIYGPCEGKHLVFVGVMTDADGTRSVAEADYTDFEVVRAAAL